MPITYEHRVPASTLGGLALAAGQEQYEAQRGREDRARAVQLAQMAQQQQMQNQRLAYDAASTQYRTAADYNKFVMGAQLDVQQRQRDHQNRLALQNNNDQLAAGREEVRWDRAQEVQGQSDTHQAWKGYVDEVRGTLNQDGIDILDTHSAKYRSIMSNQKFSPGQKAAATAQLLEEVQNKNLGESYAKEIQYEPGKSYVSPKGYKFTVLQDGSHQTLGQNFDDLIKPPEMPDSDWETKGKHVAWLDKHRFGPPGRDSDGKQTHSVEGPDGKMATITVEDEQYQAQVLKEEQIEREKDEREATTERQKNRATAIKDEMSRMDEVEGKISSMVVMENGKGRKASRKEKQEEYDRRKKAALGLAKELYPDPAGAPVEEAPEEVVEPPAAPIRDELGGEVPQTEETEVALKAGEYNSPAAKEAIRMSGMASDPEAKAVLLQAAEIHEQIALQGGKVEPHQRAILNQATAHAQRINKMRDQRLRGTDAGLSSQRRIRRGAATGIGGPGGGGTGDPVLARRMAEAGIMAGTPAGDVIMANPDSPEAQALLEERASAFPRTPEPRTMPGEAGYVGSVSQAQDEKEREKRWESGERGKPSFEEQKEKRERIRKERGELPDLSEGLGKDKRMESPAKMLEDFKQWRDPTHRRNVGKALGLLKRRVQELGLEGKLPDLMKITPLDLQKKDAMSYDRWMEWTKNDIGRATQEPQAKPKEPAKKPQAQNISQGDGQGTLTGGRVKPKAGTEADSARYGLPGKPSPEQVPGDARKFVDDEFVGRRTRTDRRDMTKELGNLKNYVTAMGLENTDTGGEILKLSPGDISVMPTKHYDAWIEEIQDMFKENGN